MPTDGDPKPSVMRLEGTISPFARFHGDGTKLPETPVQQGMRGS